MFVRHTMSRAPHCVRPTDLCIDVLRDLQERGFRHAPCVEGGKLVGVVSERDLLRALPRLVGEVDSREGQGAARLTIEAVMTRDPETCHPEDPIDRIAHRLVECRIGCMPVISGGALIGILTITDLLRAFSHHVPHPDGHSLALLWTRGDPNDAPDVPALCTKHGLRVTALLESVTEAGALAVLLHVRGEIKAVDKLLAACLDAGLLLVQERDAA